MNLRDKITFKKNLFLQHKTQTETKMYLNNNEKKSKVDSVAFLGEVLSKPTPSDLNYYSISQTILKVKMEISKWLI